MTLLQVMAADDAARVRLRTTEEAAIAAELAAHGITFDRWPVLDDAAALSSDDLLAHYADRIAALNADGRYRHIDVARIHPDDADPQWPQTARAARTKFLDEHRHAEDEVRFFAAGRGCFYLHLGAEVLAVVCEGGDLMSVPAGTLHWFDMGERPDFIAVRFFEEADGWVGDFTGDRISAGFPTLDDLLTAP
ncbi:1,2-dihydroxy-3-keto-5-methylthiopentene dioxygenase [Nocardia farcinica]|uniref:Acireductone dioxygenase 2 n=1 Tax=Nocardia farcinica (strain IFM 10152) TaxID=247156 RepID=MTND2_NOCFA|nr:acireductone dioxygenase [Nocardia farcinica]Q5YQZ5.1 RecName: Full=Acireductone dioxygenase 2; AltName: Full=1,2-dihydroxy-3-keto-5-methylthiopentene dioxygenase 2; Short=DHK-MTPene dioxygenase 2; AltName: Full=Acireductone dioxygenase (Fe(2+)-requiring) 2; Short=ARD' 2; Short=Fe-ARD 2; AltName: Full=Acireductone dioxygenase (Ni(2+)-requiring) 2; Short=ARD 2; Short=Ni-ARD 2 [Nocardia farcinica IFM 10152]BAD59396.1 putative oxidoreductase [Nocardia farcinica IFM 10152]